jgi:hypothetical protein
MSDGGSTLPPLPAPVGISAPPGLPEPDEPWPVIDDSLTPRSQAEGVDGSDMEERASADAAKSNKTNRWNKTSSTLARSNSEPFSTGGTAHTAVVAKSPWMPRIGASE